jgi:hypothetical protein
MKGPKMTKSIAFFILATLVLWNISFAQSIAKGTVFLDENKNGSHDMNEKGIPNVCVSNGIDVVETDKNGKWSLPVNNDTGLFVIKPSGYAVPVNESQIPQHYYLHKPNGSPQLATPGVGPTGPLPKSIDFPLYQNNEKGPFSALFFGDPQARGLKEVNFITRDVVQECIGTDATFGVSLGDIVADDPALFDEISASIAQIGIPWYNIFGNHDHNRDAKADSLKDETFERFFGPSTFAFEYGQTVFVGFKNILYQPDGKYKSHFTENQITFLSNWLQFVPKNKLVVLMMHAPIVRSVNSKKIYELLKDRQFTFSISGHTHQMAHVFVNEEIGWTGENPHHHFVNATVSGSWWCGLYDETGIPHATMNDGGPNGYSILTFNGNQYSIRFKAARKPEKYQMNIYLPDEIKQAAADTTKILVNVFAGSERSRVEMKFGNNDDWLELEPTLARDPACLNMFKLGPYLDLKFESKELDELLGWKMDFPSKSRHMWQGFLPPNPSLGTHTIVVKSTDMFGQSYTAHRILRVN